MITQNETDDKLTKNSFREAEKLINQSIADMGNESHIEYGVTLQPIEKPRTKGLLQWLRRTIGLN